jgi:competence protein ComEC
MTLAALAFAAGAAVLQLQAGLPSLIWAAVLLPLLLKPRFFSLPLAFGVGFFWAAACAHQRMADWLAPGLEARDVRVVGVVSSLPAHAERSVRFELETESSPDGHRLPEKLLLSWYRSALYEEGAAPIDVTVHPGERWLFTVRLRRPHGNVNPHGFDYEAWLLERGIGATGYVRTHQQLGHRNSFFDYVEKARETVRDRFNATLGPTPAAGVLAALAVGDQRAIAAEEWQLFNRTGVTHLMSISGLHVTLVSGLFAACIGFLWRRTPWLTLRFPARKAAAAAAIFAALAYTMLAGFAVPAQRTFYMVAVVAVALWAGGVATPARTLALALAAVIVADPWAPLAPGFWLSFGAVALIFYVAREGGENRVRQWTRVQWAMTIGLAPAALLLFGQVSVAGPLANALAIPLVSVVITPLALIAAVVPAEAFLAVGASLVEILLMFLEWCASLPGALWQQHAPPAWSVVLALAGVLWILAPRGVPGRAAGLALMAPAFALAPAAPAAGEAWITTFDVGQGLSVMVRTARRTLLYDAGPAFGSSDSGARVVVPALRAAGLARLEMVVLTHADMDHIGGALTVMESFDMDEVFSSLPSNHGLHATAPQARRCRAGTRWEWDGVRFEFLHPSADEWPSRRNNQSCVLRVSTQDASMLLTGDIERAAEEAILRMNPSSVRSDVLLVPHHGSRSSSSREFIDAVAPRWAVVPVGYRSRFGHPAREVLQRYQDAGAEVLRTDRDGAVTVFLNENSPKIVSERVLRARYWRRVLDG